MTYHELKAEDLKRDSRRRAEVAHELKRREVWVAAWTSVANAINCAKPADATRWADACLADYDKRFPFNI